MNNHIRIKTEDNIQMTIKKDIKQMSQLFDDLIINYDISKTSDEVMRNIFSNDLQLITDFCDKCSYQPITLRKPFWKHQVSDQVSTLNESLKNFYSNLTIEKIFDYIKICDFYGIPSLEEIIYLKLYAIFTSDHKEISEFFALKKDDHVLKMDNKIEKELREKYKIYCKVNIDEMNDEEINLYLSHLY